MKETYTLDDSTHFHSTNIFLTKYLYLTNVSLSNLSFNLPSTFLNALLSKIYKIKRTDHQSLDFVNEICIFLPPKFLPCISEMASKLSSQLANLTRAMFLSAQWLRS